jgi:hypothetical protein
VEVAGTAAGLAAVAVNSGRGAGTFKGSGLPAV